MATAPSSTHRRSVRLSRTAVLCVLTLLLFGGCSSGDAGAGEGGGDSSSGLTAGEIMKAIESDGLTCSEEDPRVKNRKEMVVCKGDDYVIITATRLADANEVPTQLAAAKKAVCENKKASGLDGMVSATSGRWILVPGGDDDKNMAAFEKSMGTLGLDHGKDAC